MGNSRVTPANFLWCTGVSWVDKKDIRADVLRRREALRRGEWASLSDIICDTMRSLTVVSGAGLVMGYVPFRNEVDVLPLLRSLLQRGARIVLPKVRKAERRIDACLVDDLEDLERGAYGILEPRSELRVDPREIDLVIVPGVAYDESRNRLGYGGGYYDRFLAALSARAVSVAPAFELQVVPQLPRDVHDRRVDIIVTEKRVIR